MSKVHKQRNQAKRQHANCSGGAKAPATEGRIDWSRWWPFTRATGKALRELNRPQLTNEEALL